MEGEDISDTARRKRVRRRRANQLPSSHIANQNMAPALNMRDPQAGRSAGRDAPRPLNINDLSVCVDVSPRGRRPAELIPLQEFDNTNNIFTQDIFTLLIVTIFVAEPIMTITNIYKNKPALRVYSFNGTPTPPVDLTTVIPLLNATINDMDPTQIPKTNTAFLTSVLTFGTFLTAYFLGSFRNSKYLKRSARQAIGHFSVPLAILIMVGVSYLMPASVDTLQIPTFLAPIATGRYWFLPFNPGLCKMPIWVIICTIVPAIMIYIVIFMETYIAELLIYKPARKLKKGSGHHSDIYIISLLNLVGSLFGAPWLSIAIVRSVNHVKAVTVMFREEVPGVKPQIKFVREQRVTALMVSVLVGLSVLATEWLKLIPMAVLFGVFMYMGVSALDGNQLCFRCKLMCQFLKCNDQPESVQNVSTSKICIFTLIQLTTFAILFILQFSIFAYALPVFIILCIPLRELLSIVFTSEELKFLDCTDHVTKSTMDPLDELDFLELSSLPS